MSGEAQAPCPPNSALMQAWKAHKATEDYINSHKWATVYIPEDDADEIMRIQESGKNPWTRHMKLRAIEGSLWAMFAAGWRAAGGENPFDKTTK